MSYDEESRNSAAVVHNYLPDAPDSTTPWGERTKADRQEIYDFIGKCLVKTQNRLKKEHIRIDLAYAYGIPMRDIDRDKAYRRLTRGDAFNWR